MSTAAEMMPAAENAPVTVIEAVLARVRALCHRRLLWLDHLAASDGEPRKKPH